MNTRRALGRLLAVLHLLALLLAVVPAGPAQAEAVLPGFLAKVATGDLVPGADGQGLVREDSPVAPVLRGGETIGWAFVTSDFVGTTGCSSKTTHTLLAPDPEARVIGARLVKHSDPSSWSASPKPRCGI